MRVCKRGCDVLDSCVLLKIALYKAIGHFFGVYIASSKHPGSGRILESYANPKRNKAAFSNFSNIVWLSQDQDWSQGQDWLMLPDLIPVAVAWSGLEYFSSPWTGCQSIAGHFPAILLGFPNNSPVPIYIPGWREALWELSVLPMPRTQHNVTDMAPFLESPGNFSGPSSQNKIPNLKIAELFYLHILNMSRGSLHARSLRRIHVPVFTYRWTKNGFTGPKRFRGFQETGPRARTRTALFGNKRTDR